MAKVISKGTPKGKSYSMIKTRVKKKRLEEEKMYKESTEFKRQNAEAKKERLANKEMKDKALQVELLDFKKGSIIIQIEDKEEKRAPQFPKYNKDNFKSKIGEIEIKIYGELYKISELKGYKEVAKKIAFELEGEFL